MASRKALVPPTYPAGATGYPSINLPHGAAPSSPVNGDVWTTTAGVYARINGVTVGPLGTGGSGGATVSSTAPGSPTSGMLWLNDTTLGLAVYYDSQWVELNQGSSGGGSGGGGGDLVLIDYGTVSAVGSFSLPDNSFDVTYDDYFLRARLTGSTNIQITVKLRVGGTDSSTSYDTTRAIHYSNTGAGQTNSLGTDEVQVANCGATQPGYFELSLISPALAEITGFDCSSQSYYNTTGYFTSRTSGVHGAATAYDSLTVLADTGTFSGRWALLGYSKTPSAGGGGGSGLTVVDVPNMWFYGM